MPFNHPSLSGLAGLSQLSSTSAPGRLPVQFSEPHSLAPYPLDAFTGLLGDIARDFCASGIDPAIVGSVLIGLVSFLTQGLADVQWPNGQRAPVGCSVLCVAPSSSGKSVIFKSLMTPIAEVLDQVAAGRSLEDPMVQGEEPQIRWRQLHTAEAANASRVSPAVPDSSVSQPPTEASDAPTAGKFAKATPAFLLEDATREAIIDHLLEWPIAGLLTEEAGQLKSMLGSSAQALIKLLDGDTLRHARVVNGRACLKDRRLTMLLMEQPAVFEASKAQLGAARGAGGFINRFMVTAGRAPSLTGALHRARLSAEVLHQYEKKVRHFLGTTIKLVRSESSRPALLLAPQACNFLERLNDCLRQEWSNHPRFSELSEYAARHSERALRLAAALHVFAFGPSGQISLATLQAADRLGRWSLAAYLELTYQPPKISFAERDAELIGQHLPALVQQARAYMFWVDDLQTMALNWGINKRRFDNALPILAESGKVTISLKGRRKAVSIHFAMPNRFSGA